MTMLYNRVILTIQAGVEKEKSGGAQGEGGGNG